MTSYVFFELSHTFSPTPPVLYRTSIETIVNPTFLVVYPAMRRPFLCLHLLLGTLYLQTFVLSTSYPPSNATWNSISSSLPLPSSHPVPAPQIRFRDFWRCINLCVCMCRRHMCIELLSLVRSRLNWTDLHQVDPVTRRVIGHVRQRHDVDWLQGCGARTAVQFVCCERGFNYQHNRNKTSPIQYTHDRVCTALRAS